VAGRIRSIEKVHLIGIRTCNLLTCSIVPQPTTLPHAPIHNYYFIKSAIYGRTAGSLRLYLTKPGIALIQSIIGVKSFKLNLGSK
jgi:hypothetical protein